MRTEAPTPNSTAKLWVIAREMLTLMILAIGSPGLVATIERLTRKTKREIKDWLCPLEALTRKLLLIDAAKLPRPSERRPAPQSWTPNRVRAYAKSLGRKPKRVHYADPNRPATWRVSFTLTLPKDTLDRKMRFDNGGPRIRRAGPPFLVRDVWRDQAAQARAAQLEAQREAKRANAAKHLAARMEAVRRAIEDPAPHAERLAQKLWRKRGGAARAARLIAEAPAPRRVRHFPEDALKLARHMARETVPLFMPADTS